MIRRMTKISVEYGIIPDRFDLSFEYNAETEKAELYYYEYSFDPEIRKATMKETRDRIEEGKWNFPNMEFETKIEKNKIGLHVKGPRKYVVWGLLNEILLQAKCVMPGDDIHYLVDEVKFLEGKE